MSKENTACFAHIGKAGFQTSGRLVVGFMRCSMWMKEGLVVHIWVVKHFGHSIDVPNFEKEKDLRNLYDCIDKRKG